MRRLPDRADIHGSPDNSLSRMSLPHRDHPLPHPILLVRSSKWDFRLTKLGRLSLPRSQVLMFKLRWKPYFLAHPHPPPTFQNKGHPEGRREKVTASRKMMDGVMNDVTRACHGHAPSTCPVHPKSGFPLHLLRPIINSRPIRSSARLVKLGRSSSNEQMRFGRRENREFRKRTKNVRRAHVPEPRGIGMANGRVGGLSG
jgi:hypothetical protein